MSATQIRESIEKLVRVLRESPEKARMRNAEAVASLVGDLKCQVTGPGAETLETDMPPTVGGGATAPSPAWLMRAALASCNATSIAMRAAIRGVELSKLEVTVSSDSDARGMLGIDRTLPAGLQNMRVAVRIRAPGTSVEALDELVRWACSHCPVGCTDASRAQLEVHIEP